jgi:hypothetical protein
MVFELLRYALEYSTGGTCSYPHLIQQMVLNDPAPHASAGTVCRYGLLSRGDYYEDFVLILWRLV